MGFDELAALGIELSAHSAVHPIFHKAPAHPPCLAPFAPSPVTHLASHPTLPVQRPGTMTRHRNLLIHVFVAFVAMSSHICQNHADSVGFVNFTVFAKNVNTGDPGGPPRNSPKHLGCFRCPFFKILRVLKNKCFLDSKIASKPKGSNTHKAHTTQKVKSL